MVVAICLLSENKLTKLKSSLVSIITIGILVGYGNGNSSSNTANNSDNIDFL